MAIVTLPTVRDAFSGDYAQRVATFSAVTRTHILQAIAEFDDRGRENFLGLYGFEPTRSYPLIHDGDEYDSTAILGVAHRYATGRAATPEEFSRGIDGAVLILRKRGFEVLDPIGAPPIVSPKAPKARANAKAPRTTTPRKSPTPEPALTMCPTCFVALPATGRCDQCD